MSAVKKDASFRSYANFEMSLDPYVIEREMRNQWEFGLNDQGKKLYSEFQACLAEYVKTRQKEILAAASPTYEKIHEERQKARKKYDDQARLLQKEQEELDRRREELFEAYEKEMKECFEKYTS